MPKEAINVNDMPEEEEVVEPEVEEEVVEKPTEPEPELILGKFKTPEDAINSIPELEKKLGEQGNEIGSLREDKAFLQAQFDKNMQKTEPNPDPEEDNLDYEAQLAEIESQVDEGELSPGEGMRKAAAITAQMSQEKTMATFQAQREQETVDHSRDTFIKDNPDFVELQQTGALEEVKAQLPGFHDDISAFYALKAANTQSSMEQAIETARAEGIALGKAEQAKVVEGANNTQKVLQTPGSDSAKNIGKKKTQLSKLEREESGLAALKAVRGS